MSKSLPPHQVAKVAAHCRKHSVWGKLPILKHARCVLGVASVPANTPDLVRKEIERQKSIAVQPKGGQTERAEPIAGLWSTLKVQLALDAIAPIIKSGTYYHTSAASDRFDARHVISIEWGAASARGETRHGGSQKYGRSGWRRTHVDWYSTITLPLDWYTRVRPKGLYRQHLVLDVYPTVRPDLNVLVLLVQRRGAQLGTKQILARLTPEGWRASSTRISALEIVLGEP